MSKSTIHKDVTDRLLQINPSLAAEARKVLDVNKSERHIRADLPPGRNISTSTPDRKPASGVEMIAVFAVFLCGIERLVSFDEKLVVGVPVFRDDAADAAGDFFRQPRHLDGAEHLQDQACLLFHDGS